MQDVRIHHGRCKWQARSEDSRGAVNDIFVKKYREDKVEEEEGKNINMFLLEKKKKYI